MATSNDFGMKFATQHSMPFNPQIAIHFTPCHVTGRWQLDESHEIALREGWHYMEGALFGLTQRFHIRIISFVMMASHFHMLVDIRNVSSDEVIRSLMNNLKKGVSKVESLGSNFGAFSINCGSHFAWAYRYVYRNPVSANLCKRAEDYPFSSLQYLLKQTKLKFPLFDATHIFTKQIPKDLGARLKWINDCTSGTSRYIGNIDERSTRIRKCGGSVSPPRTF